MAAASAPRPFGGEAVARVGVLLKVGIPNAFNTVSRNSFLRAVAEGLPDPPAMLAIALYCSGGMKSRR